MGNTLRKQHHDGIMTINTVRYKIHIQKNHQRPAMVIVSSMTSALL